jgi:hypothetical protein
MAVRPTIAPIDIVTRPFLRITTIDDRSRLDTVQANPLTRSTSTVATASIKPRCAILVKGFLPNKGFVGSSLFGVYEGFGFW